MALSELDVGLTLEFASECESSLTKELDKRTILVQSEREISLPKFLVRSEKSRIQNPVLEWSTTRNGAFLFSRA